MPVGVQGLLEKTQAVVTLDRGFMRSSRQCAHDASLGAAMYQPCINWHFWQCLKASQLLTLTPVVPSGLLRRSVGASRDA